MLTASPYNSAMLICRSQYVSGTLPTSSNPPSKFYTVVSPDVCYTPRKNDWLGDSSGFPDF